MGKLDFKQRYDVLRLLQAGKKYDEIIKEAKCSVGLVYKIKKLMDKKTVEEILHGEKRGPKVGKNRYFNDEQEIILTDNVANTMPNKEKKDGQWNLRKEQEMIFNETGIKPSYSTISRMNHRHDIVNKACNHISTLQDPEEIGNWQALFLPKLEELNKDPKNIICFYDEAGSKLKRVAHGLCRKGDTPNVYMHPSTSHNFANTLSAITTKGKFYGDIEFGYVDTERVIKFFERISKENPHKDIYFIIDNATYHTSDLFLEWLFSKRKIHVIYLPKYCPNMNVVEYFNNFYKNELRAFPTLDKDELRIILRDMFKVLETKDGYCSRFARHKGCKCFAPLFSA